MARAKRPRYDRRKEVRRLARERVGTVPASRVIEPDKRRRKAKHKNRELDERVE